MSKTRPRGFESHPSRQREQCSQGCRQTPVGSRWSRPSDNVHPSGQRTLHGAATSQSTVRTRAPAGLPRRTRATRARRSSTSCQSRRFPRTTPRRRRASARPASPESASHAGARWRPVGFHRGRGSRLLGAHPKGSVPVRFPGAGTSRGCLVHPASRAVGDRSATRATGQFSYRCAGRVGRTSALAGTASSAGSPNVLAPSTARPAGHWPVWPRVCHAPLALPLPTAHPGTQSCPLGWSPARQTGRAGSAG